MKENSQGDETLPASSRPGGGRPWMASNGGRGQQEALGDRLCSVSCDRRKEGTTSNVRGGSGSRRHWVPAGAPRRGDGRGVQGVTVPVGGKRQESGPSVSKGNERPAPSPPGPGRALEGHPAQDTASPHPHAGGPFPLPQALTSLAENPFAWTEGFF